MRVLIYLQGPGAKTAMEHASVAAHLCGLTSSLHEAEGSLLSAVQEMEEEETRYVLVTGVDERALAKTIQMEKRYCRTSVLLSSEPFSAELKTELSALGFARHLLPNTDSLASDLAATLHRIAYPAFWPLAKRMRHPRAENAVRVLTPGDLRYFSEVRSRELFTLFGGYPQVTRDGILERAAQVCDELFDNALRATLADAHGETFVLCEATAIDIAFACDGEHVGVSVTDRNGTLEPWTFFRSVFSGPEHSKGAAATSLGMGLRVTLAMSASIVASVSAGSSTCIQALLPLERSSRAAASRPKRVEYFSP